MRFGRASASPPLDPPLLYARLWEADQTLRQGLQIKPGDTVLSIAAAGDNSFALLLDDPAHVTLLDRNTTQLALCHLKMACLRTLEPPQARAFLGLEPAPAHRRLRTWRGLRDQVPGWVATRWDGALDSLQRGVLDTGKFERYLALFRDHVLPLVQSHRTIHRMATLTDLEAQRALYRQVWDSRRWRLLFRLFFSRFVMERRGRERAFFDQVQERAPAEVFRARAKKALCDLPVATNPYLVWILTGQNLHPPYLHDNTFETIASRVDRLDLVCDDLDGHLAATPPGTYDAHNLSDCFEYMAKPAADALLARLALGSKPGARLVYWNLLVQRDGSDVPTLKAHPKEAVRLHASDRAFFYGRLQLETVHPVPAAQSPAAQSPAAQSPAAQNPEP